MTTALDVDDIAADTDLVSELGSQAKLERMMPKREDRDAIRQKSLQDVVNALLVRSPPVNEGDLSDTAELKDAVVYRSLERIARAARSVAGDTFDVLARDYSREYQSAVRRQYTLQNNILSPAGFTIRLERR